MTDVKVVPYKAEHAKALNIRDLEPELADLVTDPAYLAMLETAGPGFTLIVDGVPLVCLILCRLRFPGVAEAVMLVDKGITPFRRVLHRITKRCIADVFKTEKLHRVECRINETYTRNRLWVEALGFIDEGVIHQFGPNRENYIQYGWFREGDA